MEYLLLIIGDEARANAEPAKSQTGVSPEYAAYNDALVKAGVLRGGKRLRPSSASTTVKVRDKKAVVLSGPYVESQEQIGGFYLIDVPDLDAAIDWAKRLPAAADGVIEIRPVWPTGN
jgi:hypothetical protein